MQSQNNRKWIHKLIHPNGKQGIAITASVTVILILLINAFGFKYLQTYPPNLSAFRQWDSFMGIQNLNIGVNTLLLGDSTCHANLDTGVFADRLGGRVIDLSVYGGMSIITDAWLLSAYIQKFGPPANVVVSRLSSGYSTSHEIEFMAAPSLPWGYWDKLGVAPAWQPGELTDLFLNKYLVLYSYAEVIRDRLSKFKDLFDTTRHPLVQSQIYTRGSAAGQEKMDISTRQPGSLFRQFEPCLDATNAIRYMANLARQKQFQLYFVFQPEWDEALNTGLRQPILEDQVKYLSQFVDPTYVHIIRNESLSFTKDQMQNHAHLRPGADHVKTESDISRIVEIQNQLTSNEAITLTLDTITLNKPSYQTLDKPVIDVSFSAQNKAGKNGLTGSVSCLAKPSGKTDGDWASRASAKEFNVGSDGKVKLKLKLDIGNLNKAGTYDLVIFLRQNIGELSNEKRIELHDKIIVSRSDIPDNSSFEKDSNSDGIPDDWTVDKTYIRKSMDQASDGSNSLKFDMAGTDVSRRRAYSALIPVSSGAIYSGSIDTYYSNMSTTSGSISIMYYTSWDGSGKPLTIKLASPKAGVGFWQTVTFNWSPPNEAQSFRILLSAAITAIATQYWDNLNLSEIIP